MAAGLGAGSARGTGGMITKIKAAKKVMEAYQSGEDLGLTQEELASICNVSRQSISKWEADIALPETEKLLILGETFHVSMDVHCLKGETRGKVWSSFKFWWEKMISCNK